MQRLWAPWRQGYLMKPAAKGCVFCNAASSRDDRKALVVHRGRDVLCMLNLYPYSNGHLLVAPKRHLRSLSQLKAHEATELLRTTALMERRLTALLHPQGFNIGLNLGRAAGAGIPGHLHLHVVPRWIGDTNFMPLLGQTKVLSISLRTLYQQLVRG